MPSDHDKSRILVVEDDYSIRVLLHALLSSDFDVELAATFDGALEVARRQPFDLFLLDINLGEARTGIDLLTRLRQMPGCGATLAVACTSFSGEENRKFLLSCGFDGYICKPFASYELLYAIEQALTRKRLKGQGQRVGINTVAPGIKATWQERRIS